MSIPETPPGPREDAASVVRVRVALALLALDVVVLILIAAGVHGPVRFVLGLAFALLVPGWSVVGLLRLERPALEASLTVATSLSVLLVAAQLLLTLSLWHLEVFAIVLGVLCMPSLLWQFLERTRPSRGSR